MAVMPLSDTSFKTLPVIGNVMKKVVVNKNIHHNGKAYEKGSVLKHDDAFAVQLVKSGHADVVGEEKEEVLPVAVVSEAQSEEPVKPAKSRKFKA